ncbi:MAG: tetratricopeptide repeat-containing serine protease family protein [Alphaproteobacteria bacterium]
MFTFNFGRAAAGLAGVACLALVFSIPAHAGLNEALAAYERKDYAAAFREFMPLAEQGNAEAQFFLGRMYAFGQGVPVDDREAFRWFRLAADQNLGKAQNNLGNMYAEGRGVPQNYQEALRLYRLAAEQGYAPGQTNVGSAYYYGYGVAKDQAEAVKWWRLAAAQDHAAAQYNLGFAFSDGTGVNKDMAEAAKWFQRAAEQNEPKSQLNLGVMFLNGEGVPQDYVQAHLWFNLAASSPNKDVAQKAAEGRRAVEKVMTAGQLAQAQAAARDWKPRNSGGTTEPKGGGSGSGFMVSRAGHVLTNEHVVGKCTEVRAGLPGEPHPQVEVVALDATNDLAILKMPAPSASIATFRDGGVRVGEGVVVFGYPLRGTISSQGSLTTGTVSALAGLRDDSRALQISAPVQPGNSGGPLFDMSGNVIGVVSSRLNEIYMLERTGQLPQNINFAIKGSIAQSFLEANQIQYVKAKPGPELKATDVGERAQRVTVQIECLR